MAFEPAPSSLVAPKASVAVASSSPWDPVPSNGRAGVAGVDDEFDLLSNRSKSPTGANSLSFDLAGGTLDCVVSLIERHSVMYN